MDELLAHTHKDKGVRGNYVESKFKNGQEFSYEKKGIGNERFMLSWCLDSLGMIALE